MIRSVLHMDPAPLDDEDWALHVILAESVQNMYLRKLGRLLGRSG